MSGKRSILIIDDDVDFCEMAKLMLEKTGLYDVSVCNNSSEAMDWVRGRKPELILLDVVMPNVDGGEIAAQLKGNKEFSSIPVIFMTSLMTASEAAKNPSIGKHRFISKPISGEALAEQMRKFFRSHENRPS